MKILIHTVILVTLSRLATAAPVHLVDESPRSIQRVSPDVLLVDFGKVAFANLRLTPPANSNHEITVCFGEDLRDGRINRKPQGTVRYSSVTIRISGDSPVLVAPPADGRNTQSKSPNTPPAILTPAEWGVVTPFRWVEIEGWPGELQPQYIHRKSAFLSTWDDNAAAFDCSDETLVRIWQLCRYSIKATSFTGIYVDGDRERIPYEADAYLNQLSHYATDHDKTMARDTFDHLMKHPTWPTEWAFHMIFMAHADYLHTGDGAWLSSRFDSLKAKLLLERAREDGLLVSNESQVRKDDIVDWPKPERDGFVFKPVNSVVNAFHIRSLQMMADMAAALGRQKEAETYRSMADKAGRAFQKTFFDESKGAYRDGEGSDHTSIHASLFPLAFGMVPAEHTGSVVDFIRRKGMACSVYAAQYLLEGLFANEAADTALALITARTDRSWRHMVDDGATITWEAWDVKYKPNLDWNHAWGAAPANLLPRFVLGAEPVEPGWKTARIRPNTGDLKYANGKIPTPLGPITVAWENKSSFQMTLELPPGMKASLELPAAPSSKGVKLNGTSVPAKRHGSRWVLTNVSGKAGVVVE